MEGEPLLVAGWGWIDDKVAQLTVDLRQVRLPYAGDSCARYYNGYGGGRQWSVNGSLTFCAGDLDRGGAGICRGDEGGAAVSRRSTGGQQRSIISGIASYVGACGQPKLISLFTRVSSYTHWINGNVVGDGDSRLACSP